MWFSLDQDEHNVLRQLDKDSDRAAAIVAATVIERRLTNAITSRLRKHPQIHKQLFRTSGPLGNFSTKIDLARVMGITSADAHRDLVTMKDIRNAFAHHLDVIDFSSQRTRDLCNNLQFFEAYVDEMDQDKKWLIRLQRPDEKNRRIVLRIKDVEQELKKPRNRYLASAAVFSSLLMMIPSNEPPLPGHRF